VLRFAGLPDDPPVDDAGQVLLGENHTVTGNPDRLRRGSAVIRSDDRWRAGLTGRQLAAATVAALPMLRRYDYPLMPTR
jgi:hypothetical protein